MNATVIECKDGIWRDETEIRADERERIADYLQDALNYHKQHRTDTTLAVLEASLSNVRDGTYREDK